MVFKQTNEHKCKISVTGGKILSEMSPTTTELIYTTTLRDTAQYIDSVGVPL